MTKYCTADPRLTDYDTLLKNIQDLKSGQPTQVSAAAMHTSFALPAAHAQLAAFAQSANVLVTSCCHDMACAAASFLHSLPMYCCQNKTCTQSSLHKLPMCCIACKQTALHNLPMYCCHGSPHTAGLLFHLLSVSKVMYCWLIISRVMGSCPSCLCHCCSGLPKAQSWGLQVPIYDFKLSKRVGYRTQAVPNSRVVIIEGIYSLSTRLRYSSRLCACGGSLSHSWCKSGHY